MENNWEIKPLTCKGAHLSGVWQKSQKQANEVRNGADNEYKNHR